MFLTTSRSGYVAGGQYCSGDFLMIFQHYEQGSGRELRCLVRKVALKQMGHWMMGRVILCGKEYVLSGCYGSDGLPMIAYPELWERLHPLPPDLTEALWKGGGHNTGGSEMEPIRKWALEHLKELKHLKEKAGS